MLIVKQRKTVHSSVYAVKVPLQSLEVSVVGGWEESFQTVPGQHHHVCWLARCLTRMTSRPTGCLAACILDDLLGPLCT